MTFEQFCKKNKLTADTWERPKEYVEEQGLERYYASFMAVNWVRNDNKSMTSLFGNGNTEEEAVEDLKSKIAGKVILKNSRKTGLASVEIQCPVTFDNC